MRTLIVTSEDTTAYASSLLVTTYELVYCQGYPVGFIKYVQTYRSAILRLNYLVGASLCVHPIFELHIKTCITQLDIYSYLIDQDNGILTESIFTSTEEGIPGLTSIYEINSSIAGSQQSGLDLEIIGKSDEE